MVIRQLYSQRAKEAARAGKPDVYTYDSFTPGFRAQVIHIWTRAIGEIFPNAQYGDNETSVWDLIARTLAEEHGLLQIGDPKWPEPSLKRCSDYFLQLPGTGHILDVIECAFNAMDEHVRPEWGGPADINEQSPDDAIADLNHRFRQHALGYQYANGKIIRVDSEFIHAEAVKPALALLQDPAFAGPQNEFMEAHRHYREGDHMSAINEALKAFESTMKTICDARSWTYEKNKATAKPLIDIVLAQSLLPEIVSGSFAGLRTVLESVAVMRNRWTGHGGGPNPAPVPPHLAAYVLHVTASNIVLLVEAHKAMK